MLNHTMLDLHHVRTFCVVTDTNNFTVAAARLGCSQATVTTHIQALESELGVRLFERKRFARNVRLTEIGHLMLRYSRELLSLAEKTVAVIRRGEVKASA